MEACFKKYNIGDKNYMSSWKNEKAMKNDYYQDFKAYFFFYYFVQSFIPIFGPQLSLQTLEKLQIIDFPEKLSWKYPEIMIPCPQKHAFRLKIRDGVLEDFLGLEDVLEDTFWSPWPWPRSTKSLALALASKPQVLENCPVLGSRTALFFEQLKSRWKTPETSRKICEHLFCFPHLEHRRRKGEGGPPQLKFHQWQTILLFLQFQFLFSIFCWLQYN